MMKYIKFHLAFTLSQHHCYTIENKCLICKVRKPASIVLRIKNPELVRK